MPVFISKSKRRRLHPILYDDFPRKKRIKDLNFYVNFSAQSQAAGRERKLASKEEKERIKAQKQEQTETIKWQIGAKDETKKAQEESKRIEKLTQKKERDQQLAREEAELVSKYKPVRNSPKSNEHLRSYTPPSAFSVSSIDDDLAIATDDDTTLTDTAAIKPSDMSIDRHPERRMKAAYSEFEAKEYPILKSQYPTLKHSQLLQLLQKKWKKSAENPYNRNLIAYNASRGETMDTINEEIIPKLSATKL